MLQKSEFLLYRPNNLVVATIFGCDWLRQHQIASNVYKCVWQYSIVHSGLVKRPFICVLCGGDLNGFK